MRSLDATPNNLPQQMTSFVGREHEIADVRKLLGTARVLTLHGAGGIGKTRLSLQVAADVLEDYPDGVWFVELAPLTDERLVPQAVASILGAKEEAGRNVTDALVKHVADRHLLLVLDNCEHLAPCLRGLGRPAVGGLVPTCGFWHPAASRCGCRARLLSRCPALALQASQDAGVVASLLQFPALRLFIDRATAAHPGFSLTDDNALAVTEICQRLDGIPLAIELAAARVRALSVENIAARLSDRFRLLLVQPHRAAEATDAARADRLELRSAHRQGAAPASPARRLCRRLDDRSDRKRCVQAAASTRPKVLGLLSDLVDKSLVMVVAEGGRYRLLETVRQYAEERLTQSGESDATRLRHAAFYLELVEKLAPELHGAAQADGLQRFDLERENILAAHAWCLHNEGSAEQDYRLVHAIKHYWFMRGLLNLGHRVTVEAVTNSSGQANSLARCKALWAAGQFCGFMGRYEEAQGYLDESLAIARAVDDRDVMVPVLNNLGMVALGRGDRANARLYGEEALALARQTGNKRRIVTASNALAQLHRLEGDLQSAERLYRECESLARELGNHDFTAVALLNLAMVAIAQGSAQRGAALLLEVLDISAETGSKPAVQSVLEVSAGLAGLRGEWERAARYYGAAETQTRITGMQRDAADEAFLGPLIAQTRAALGPARSDAAESAGRALPFQDVLADVRAWLSII